MTKMLAFQIKTKKRRLAGGVAVAVLAAAACAAQTPAPRILLQPNSTQMSTLKGTLHPFTRSSQDAGPVPADTHLAGISIAFNRTAAQQAALNQLLADQQNPSSPLYHQWLTPQQFAARFGMAQSDIDKVELWLQQQGFSIDSVDKSRNRIRFSGTVGQVQQAFQTQMRYYEVGGKKVFAPSTALSVPAAFASTVANVGNLSSLRPHAQYIPYKPANPRAAFTSAASGNVFFAPGDIKIAYDMNPVISAGYDGTGQTIVIVGQSAVSLSDIANFENAAGYTSLVNKPPTTVLIPGSGTSAFYAGDQGESDLDLEWSSTMAPGATVYFVYTGSSPNFSVFDSIDFAVDNGLGDVISASYGACEAGNSPSSLTVYESVYAQAAAQGQTIVAASGDQGSTACYTGGSGSLSTQEALSVNYPASSAYVTAVGGTEITDANDASGNSYFSSKQSTDALTSVLKYIPEVAWNDDDPSFGLSSTGGGISTVIAQPSWQKNYFTATGKTNPGASGRLVPDISLYSSPNNPGYLYCTSDTSDWAGGQAASCNSGFRDSSTTDLTVAGGTSFAAPIFAGMVAVLNQKNSFTSGQGLVNPTFYSLASNSTTYAAVFHDVTAGGPNGTAGLGNGCSLAGSTYCSSTNISTNKYPTAANYDLATGLGSFDFAALAGVWPTGNATLIGTTTSVSASNSAPNSGDNVTFTVTVTPDSGATAPTGSVTLVIDGGPTLGGTTSTQTLTASDTAATTTYTTSFTAAGGHSVVAQYAGNSTFGASTGAASVTIGGSGSGTGSFTIDASDVTIPRGSSGSSTITVTPSGGYTGAVFLNFDTSNDTALANLCYQFATTLSNGDGAVAIVNTNSVSTTLLFDTKASDCATGGVAKPKGSAFHRLGDSLHTAASHNPRRPGPLPAGLAFAGLLFAGFLAKTSKRFRTLAMLLLLVSIGFGLSACGGSSVSNPPKGTYTITVVGQDSASASISASTTFTLTIN
ncbi:MAG TPA: protease pro-enzyme activation domain-containing protein [Terracidiphilus sp.]|nr:protease pro-enzyme activation domain-containing protein [Terracidiphilus sp.]